jgi:hypothetical protein
MLASRAARVGCSLRVVVVRAGAARHPHLRRALPASTQTQTRDEQESEKRKYGDESMPESHVAIVPRERDRVKSVQT